MEPSRSGGIFHGHPQHLLSLELHGAPRGRESLAVALVIYVLAGAIASILNVVLGWIPLVGVLTQVAAILLWIYAILGSLLAVALFFREGKNS